jgi:hypothetical protein
MRRASLMLTCVFSIALMGILAALETHPDRIPGSPIPTGACLDLTDPGPLLLDHVRLCRSVDQRA